MFHNNNSMFGVANLGLPCKIINHVVLYKVLEYCLGILKGEQKYCDVLTSAEQSYNTGLLYL